MVSIARRPRIWIGALGAAALIGSISLVYHERYVASLGAVRESSALQEHIAEALSLLKDAETGQGGYGSSEQSASARRLEEVDRMLDRERVQLGNRERAAMFAKSERAS